MRFYKSPKNEEEQDNLVSSFFSVKDSNIILPPFGWLIVKHIFSGRSGLESLWLLRFRVHLCSCNRRAKWDLRGYRVQVVLLLNNLSFMDDQIVPWASYSKVICSEKTLSLAIITCNFAQNVRITRGNLSIFDTFPRVIGYFLSLISLILISKETRPYIQNWRMHGLYFFRLRLSLKCCIAYCLIDITYWDNQSNLLPHPKLLRYLCGRKKLLICVYYGIWSNRNCQQWQ